MSMPFSLTDQKFKQQTEMKQKETKMHISLSLKTTTHSYFKKKKIARDLQIKARAIENFCLSKHKRLITQHPNMTLCSMSVV
jgi:hypothetical protein